MGEVTSLESTGEGLSQELQTTEWQQDCVGKSLRLGEGANNGDNNSPLPFPASLTSERLLEEIDSPLLAAHQRLDTHPDST